MSKKLKGIPPIQYGDSAGRPPIHDFSKLEVGEGIEATKSMIVCAHIYGRRSGKVFVQRKRDGKLYLYRKS